MLRTAIFGAALLLTTPAHGMDFLVLVVDCSGSISAQEYALQKQAYVKILTDPRTQSALRKTQVAIVEFGSGAQVVVPWTTVAEAGQSYAERGRRCAGQTRISLALHEALRLLRGKEGRRVIDISGDGSESFDHKTVAFYRRVALERAVEINALVIVDAEPNIVEYYTKHVITGFAIEVATMEQIEGGLRRKIFFEMAELE